jgi:putative ABC transport system permease protein
MFGILWGVVSVVVLTATGEGFQRGNTKVLEELGKNVGILWGGRTSLQAGGERAGRPIQLTVGDARALATESDMIAVVSPELQRFLSIRSAFNSASLNVHGIEPQYQAIRTIDIERGRMFRFTDEQSALRVAIVGADATAQLFGTRESLGQTVYIHGLPYTVIGKIRKKDQDSNYSGPDNDKVFVPFAAMMRDFPAHRRRGRRGVEHHRHAAAMGAGAAPRRAQQPHRPHRGHRLAARAEVRRVLAPRHRFDADDRNAVAMWDTTLQTLMFGRMIEHMKVFFTVVGVVTLSLGGLGVMNIMLVAVRERTREIGVRKALGATTGNVQRQFFLEGFILTMLSGTVGFGAALGLCALLNTLPMPTRFSAWSSRRRPASPPSSRSPSSA